MRSLPPTQALELDWSWWCPEHRAVLDHMLPADTRKSRSMAAFVILFQALLSSPHFELECLGNTNNIRGVCAAHAPLCCYIGEPALRRVYKKVGAFYGSS